MAYFVVRVFALSGTHDVAALQGRCDVPCWRSLGGAEVKSLYRLYALTPTMFIMLRQIAELQEVPVSTIVREDVESYLAKG